MVLVSAMLCLMMFVGGLVYGCLVVVLLAVAVVELVRWPDVVVERGMVLEIQRVCKRQISKE